LIDRRQVRRRRIPFVRSAVLEWAGRAHIVALADLGPEGAFLSTRSPFPVGESALLKLVLPRQGQEVTIACEIVRSSDRFDPASGQPAGVAVRFRSLKGEVLRKIEGFAREGFVPDPDPPPAERYEYRLLDRPAVDPVELNRLGLDGWALASVAPRPAGVQLILFRLL
jgi:Tfp pilus assembly protein PilZ